MTDPWDESIPSNYEETMKEFGIEPFDEISEKIPEPNRLIRRKIIFGHRDFERILERITEKKKYVVMTGLMPSGKMHLGHKVIVDQLIWHLEKGATIYLCIADLEAVSTRKITREEARRLSVKEYIGNCLALGLDLDKCNLYFQSENKVVQNLAITLGTKVNFSELMAIYGFSGESNASHTFYPLIDAADILHPQLEILEGPNPTLIPVGRKS